MPESIRTRSSWFRPKAALAYAALDAPSNHLVHLLVGRGIGVGDVVGLYLDRPVEIAVTVLGILKSGRPTWRSNSGTRRNVERSSCAAAVLDVVPRQLLAPPRQFTNRATDLRAMHDAFGEAANPEAAGLLLVTGPGGVGKTALVLRWCASVSDQFPDGQLFADCGGFGVDGPVPPGRILSGWLRALGVPPELVPVELAEQAGLFRSVTAGRRMLVLADDAASAAQVLPLRPSSPGSVMVVTSRWRLGGLLVEGARLVRLTALSQQDAAELLMSAAGRSRLSADIEQVQTLAGLCGGLPIALNLAAAQLASRPMWPVARLVARLGDEGQRLARLAVEGDGAVEAAFNLSYQALPEDASRLYRLASLHPGPDFTSGLAAAAVDVGEEQADELLGQLVAANLVEEIGEDRYRFHDLLRVHARGLAGQAECQRENADAVLRMLRWLLDAAVRADLVVMPGRPRQGDRYQAARNEPARFATPTLALEWLERHRPHLVAAVYLADEYGFDSLCWQFCEALWGLFQQHKNFEDWIGTHQVGVAAARRVGDDCAQIWIRCQLGLGLLELGRLEAACQEIEPGLMLARSCGDRFLEAVVLQHLGMIARAQHRFDDAVDYLHQSLEIMREVGSARDVGIRLMQVGETLLETGEYPQAATHLQQARDLFTQIGDGYNQACAVSALGEVAHATGSRDEAVVLLNEALDRMREQGSRFHQARLLARLADFAEDAGMPEAAGQYLSEAGRVYPGVGNPLAAKLRRRLNALAIEAGEDQPGGL